MKGQNAGKRRGRRRIATPQIGEERRIVRASLYSQATERLRSMIVRGELKPGERLGEIALCEALDVSRTPLREALKLLAAEKLVELRQNRGAVIARLDPKEIPALFEAASGMERLAAELAAQRLTAGDLKELGRLQVQMERHHETGNLEFYFAINQRIHRTIVAGSKNDVLVATHEWLLGRIQRARYFALRSQARWDESVEEHRQILAALERRDSEVAGRLVADHVRRTGDVVSSVLAAHSEEAA